ncbi:MAG: hypothetical protein GC164_04685 [Phycisphaera sp.]|nr:hypothetical protein [Phycisphaera sp.]
MLPRERVIETIQHHKPDRTPFYMWVRANMNEPITQRFGSVEAFEDHYQFDMAHLFGTPARYTPGALKPFRDRGQPPEPAELLDVPITDPDDLSVYDEIKRGVEHHKNQRGRFVYVQTPGIFEANNGYFGIENHLMYLALYEDDLHRVYARQAQWNKRFAMNCLDLGVDMVHVSDDWGGQTSLLFSPDMWHRLIKPYHKVTCDAVKQRSGFLSLHSDGNIRSVLDETIKLGFDVIHPFQESAGMDLTEYRERYIDRFTVMGGLCVQTTIGFNKRDFLEKEIRRVLSMFKDGGLLYCTSHFVQNHCSIDELLFAADLVRELL